MKDDIGKRLKQFRLERGLSLEYVAEKVGISVKKLESIESDICKIRFLLLAQICDVYGIDIKFQSRKNVKNQKDRHV